MPDHMHAVEKRPRKYLQDEKDRELLRMLREGTKALRRDPRKWIPPRSKEQLESRGQGLDSDYDERVKRTIVDPFFDSAVSRACGTVLSQPIALGEDVPDVLKEYWQNVDLKDNKGDIFLKEVLDDALGDGGMSHVLTDHQPAGDDPNGGRPYWVHVRARDLLPPKFEIINGEPRLLEVRIIEGMQREDFKDPYGDPEDVERIRILRAPAADDTDPNRELARRLRSGIDDPNERLQELRAVSPWVTWELWEIGENDNGEKNRSLIGSGTMEPHTSIPLKTLYVGKKGEYDAESPFQHLAYENLLHTQRQSDIETSIRIRLGATLHRVVGHDDEAKNQRVIGDLALIWTTHEAGSAQWLEMDGSSTKAAMDWQESLENRMRALGNEPLIRRVGPETATGREIDETEAKTDAQAWAIAMEDFTVNILDDMAIFEGLDSGGTVSVPTPDAMNEIDLPVLEFWRDTNEKSGWPRPETIMEMAKNSSMLPDDLDTDMEMMRIREEMP